MAIVPFSRQMMKNSWEFYRGGIAMQNIDLERNEYFLSYDPETKKVSTIR